MDLEKFKKTWINQPENSEKLSKVDIYRLTQSKSSSIVKWILIIGILELIFWTSINFITPKSFMEIYKDFNMIGFLNAYTILHYLIIIAFLILFYKNYSSISIIDSTKVLMKKILKVRKTVKYYVYYNLAGLVITNIIITSVFLSKPDTLMKALNPNGVSVEITTVLSVFLIATIVLVLIIFLILWLFYKFTYGKLLKKLNINYLELDKLEKLN